MTGTGSDSTTATVQLFDNAVPPVTGSYVITATLSADAIVANVAPTTQAITFAAPQVTLDAAEIVQCSPPPSASGPFDEVLASVLLAEPSLPWERQMPTPGCPWLALLLFAEGELLGGDSVTHGTAATVTEFLAITDAVVPLIVLDASVASDQLCTYIRVPATLFTAVTPRLDELPWLAHVRRPGLDGSADATADLGVVVANRFPPVPAAPDGGSATAIAHLVSVEGLAPGWSTPQPSPAQDGPTAGLSSTRSSCSRWLAGRSTSSPTRPSRSRDWRSTCYGPSTTR